MNPTPAEKAEHYWLMLPRHSGRTRAKELLIMAEAQTPREAELAITDLHEKGFAVMCDGKRFVPPAATPPKIVWDEVEP